MFSFHLNRKKSTPLMTHLDFPKSQIPSSTTYDSKRVKKKKKKKNLGKSIPLSMIGGNT